MATIPVQQTDVVVIGGGSTGENVAARAVRGGLDAVLVEAELVGGECSYWACMPSKALLRPGHALAAARRLPGAAAAITGELDAAKVLARRDEFTSHWQDDSQVEWAEGAGIRVVRGRGRLVEPKLVEVVDGHCEPTRVEARQAVVIATGSRPSSPPIEGLERVVTWTSREATSAKSVPDRLAVLGGGVAGSEMAQAFARLGSEVTLLARGQVLARFEPKVGELVVDGLRADGVDVRTGVEVNGVSADGGPVTITMASGGEIVADELLVATGRRPRTDDVGLDTVGVDGSKPLPVDTTGRVDGVDGGWLYAAGDAAGTAPLTHMGKYAARAVGDVIAARAAGHENVHDWSPHATTALQRAVTQVVFTDPEVAAVGLTEARAGEAGLHVRCIDLDIAVAGSSLHADGYTGWARLVVDSNRAVVVGATFVGQDVAELLHSATVAVVGEVPLDRLWHAVPSYPTISEVWLRLLEAAGL